MKKRYVQSKVLTYSFATSYVIIGTLWDITRNNVKKMDFAFWLKAMEGFKYVSIILIACIGISMIMTLHYRQKIEKRRVALSRRLEKMRKAA